MAEHRVYVASAGIALVVAGMASRSLDRPGNAAEPVPIWFKVGVPTLLAMCMMLTLERNRVWHSPVAVWREAIAASPGMWEPRYALADALREAGDCAPALAEYQAVLAERPRHREALTNYGICLGQLGRLPEAAAVFRQALAVDPNYARGYTNLAAVSLLEGDAAQARDYYVRAIAVDPKNVHARMQLAAIYEERLQDYARAAQMCGEARAISPSTPGASECVARNQERVRRPGFGGTP
jgi:tetratricopeptide (TPR) repeat protein